MATSFQDLLKEQTESFDDSGIALTSLDDDDLVAYFNSLFSFLFWIILRSVLDKYMTQSDVFSQQKRMPLSK
jgi:hypothetical protein